MEFGIIYSGTRIARNSYQQLIRRIIEINSSSCTNKPNTLTYRWPLPLPITNPVENSSMPILITINGMIK